MRRYSRKASLRSGSLALLNAYPESTFHSGGRSTVTTRIPRPDIMSSITRRWATAALVPDMSSAKTPSLVGHRHTTFLPRRTGVAAATRSGTSGNPSVRASLASGPAIDCSMIAASLMSRAIGPG